MRFLLLALALATAPHSFAGDGPCKDTYLPPFKSSDSIQILRAKILSHGFFPIMSTDPRSVPEKVIRSGFFEFSSCQHSSAFDGCFANWVTRYGERVSIAFPADGRPPFISDCPASMRH